MGPRVELLYSADCPNYQDALTDLRVALGRAGIAARIDLIAVETMAEADRWRFYGSPTIRIDGRDVAPPPAGIVGHGLACRVYRDANGCPMPRPPLEIILAALSRHHGPD